MNDPQSVFSSSSSAKSSTESSTSSSSSKGSVTGSGELQKAKIASKKDDIKKLIRDLNMIRSEKIKEHNEQEVKTQTLTTIDEIFDQAVVGPQSEQLYNGTKVASLGDVKIKKEPKQTMTLETNKAKKIKKKVSKKIRRKKRKKRRGKSLERRKLSPDHSKMLKAKEPIEESIKP